MTRRKRMIIWQEGVGEIVADDGVRGRGHITVFRRAAIMAVSLLITIVFIGTVTSNADEPESREEISSAIRNHIECQFFRLTPGVQKHYALRMYRITGDNEYLSPIIFDLLLTVERTRADVDHIADSVYRDQRQKDMLDEFNDASRKGRMRKDYFEKHADALFSLNLLYNVNTIADYGLDTGEYRDLCDRAKAILRNTDFASWLLDPELVRTYAAQAVNYVYYLHDLGIRDLRDEYETRFKEVFPDKDDDWLSKLEYRDKLYGLTHFIFASSQYYQHPVDSNAYGWIIDYFNTNLGRIIDDGTEDIVAEVGICYLLTGSTNENLLVRCRNSVLDGFDRDAEMIPSPHGSDDLEKGEHRNVLAYMLLNWPEHLHEGPPLARMDAYRGLSPHRKDGREP